MMKNLIACIDASFPTPDADDEVHRDQHHFPHHVKQEEVARDEDADMPLVRTSISAKNW
jgi:hypothetical protein